MGVAVDGGGGGGRRIPSGTVSFILRGAGVGGDGDEQGGPEEGEVGVDAAYLRLSSAIDSGPPGVARCGGGGAFVHVHSPSQTGQMSSSSSSGISV